MIKYQRYPITFVVKTEETTETITEKLRQRATAKYVVKKIVDRYIACVEEIINVPMLVAQFAAIVSQGQIRPVVEEIILQSRVEFNVEEEGGGVLAFDKSNDEDDVDKAQPSII